jgi:4-amino-4-deoxy-L-arabinose transferase-like glycosyltransferase
MNMKYFRKYYFLLILFLLIAGYWLSRLVNLTIIPIFTDEAIYLRWAQIALGDPRWRFISLIDGKQPLLIWIMMPFLKVISDPLIAGRLVSIIAGFTAMTGLGIFGWLVTKSKKSALIGFLLYLVIPFFLVYDRLALYDALFGALAVWTYLFLYLLGKTLRLDVALILGTLIGFGLLTKSYAYFFLILLPLTLLLVKWDRKTWKKTLLRFVALCMVIIIQSQIYENILRLSEFRHYVAAKNLQFIYSFSEFLANPIHNTWGNLIGLSGWLISYLTLPLIILVIIAFIYLLRKSLTQGLYFLGWFVIPFMALAVFGKIIYPRFILFMVFPLLLPIIILLEEKIVNIKKQLLLLIIMLIISIPILDFDRKILFDPVHAPLPNADRQQLISDWPSGYGIKEVVAYLEEASKGQKIIVGTDGTFGLYPMALELYLGKNVNVTFKPYWPLNEFPKELIEDAKTMPTYLLFKERQEPESGWPLELIAQYERGDGPTYLKFYRVLPKT